MEPQKTILNVFIVDDEPGMRTGAQRALENFIVPLPDLHEEVAFSLRAFESAEGLEETIKTTVPDLLLLDNKLPGKSGVTLLEEFARDNFPICTIMITAYATLESAIETIKLGAYDFLPKPFTPDELRYTVSKATRSVLLARQARKLAKEKKRVRFEFITVLAHELKAPLNAVESYLDIFRNRRAGEKLEDYTQMLDRTLVRIQGMRKLILDLLDLTAIESGDRVRKIAPIDLYQVAYQTLDQLREEAGTAKVSLHLAPGGPAMMAADLEDMEIILRNLVSNAIKYNRPGGHVDISVGQTNSGFSISVSDTGIGMTPEEQVLLFKEFSRIKNDKTLHIPGSGLGLSIVKKVVTLYNGDIAVKSESGKGTLFAVTLKSRK
jgi:signal transduction histidine kinase